MFCGYFDYNNKKGKNIFMHNKDEYYYCFTRYVYMCLLEEKHT